jgi:hypothetical protein
MLLAAKYQYKAIEHHRNTRHVLDLKLFGGGGWFTRRHDNRTQAKFGNDTELRCLVRYDVRRQKPPKTMMDGFVEAVHQSTVGQKAIAKSLSRVTSYRAPRAEPPDGLARDKSST